jgi:alkylation response protein AidB-like acyl-CoA dehydrogenase
VGDGLAQCLVPASASGVQVEALASVDLVRRFATVRFDAVRVPAERIVGTVGDAADAVERQLHLAIVLQCAEVVGALDRVLEFTLEYLGDRSSFGRPLSSYQAIKHRIADMKMWIEGCHGVTELAVRAVQDDDPDAREIVSAAASYLGDHASEILQECTQLHGGIGVTWEHDLHLYLRRITLHRNLFGTPAEHRERIAEAIISRHGPGIERELAGA